MYLDCKKNGLPSVCSRDVKFQCSEIVEYFDAAASKSEKAIIAGVATGSITRHHKETAMRIQKRFLQRLADEYVKIGMKVPEKHYQDLKATMLCKRVKVRIEGGNVKFPSLRCVNLSFASISECANGPNWIRQYKHWSSRLFLSHSQRLPQVY